MNTLVISEDVKALPVEDAVARLLNIDYIPPVFLSSPYSKHSVTKLNVIAITREPPQLQHWLNGKLNVVLTPAQADSIWLNRSLNCFVTKWR